MSLSKFESMLKTNSVFFFDSVEFEEIIQHYLDAGKRSLAKKAIQLGLEQHPTSVLLKLLKVELLVFDSQLKKAMQLLNEIEQIEANNDEVFVQKAIIYSKSNEHKKAIETFRMALKFSNNPEDIYAMIGMEFLYLDAFTKARENFEKCLEIDLEDYSSLYNVVYCFDMESNHKGAVNYLNNYINKNPYCEVAWHQLGRQYFVLNQLEEALKSFDYAVVVDEDFIGGYLEKAKTLEALHRYEEAIDNYLITIELDDPTSYAYLRIGECYVQLQNYSKSIEYYKKSLIEDPLLDKGWALLSDIYALQEDTQKALYYINKALQIDENNTSYWRKYASINVTLDFYEEVAKAFYNCLDLGDVSLEVYIGLADVLLLLGEEKEALRILITAKKTYRDFTEIEYRLCGVFYLLNKKEYSLIHLKNGLIIDAENHSIIRKIFPIAFKDKQIQMLIANHMKSN